MHENFLTSRENYSQARKFWARLCADAIALHSTAAEWTPWLSTHLVESDSSQLDECIYSLYSAKQNRAITIKQYAPGYASWGIYARTNKFGVDVLDPPIDYLLIGCVIDEKTAQMAATLIAEWANPKLDITQMDALIDRTLNCKG